MVRKKTNQTKKKKKNPTKQTNKQNKQTKNKNEGFRPEWCISSMVYNRGTPFWSGTLDIIVEIYHSNRRPSKINLERLFDIGISRTG